ncbi:hypothetical protein [Sphingomonas phyllosphaerae]|uniref:phosphoribosyltransferase-like protein n=1 Tax=Sphingomonas phyllosphaerae TaxID=257003 RepID=UPI0003B31FAF|nr:hypothetical protein [Sphingomonas phyllosphaerae]
MTMASELMADETQVLEACERLVDLHVWPRRAVEYRGWLDNFDKSDRPLAVHMLSRFTYFSHELVDQLFLSAFHTLSNVVVPAAPSPQARREAWQRFVDTVAVVPVMGERPNPSDSGWGFARKARQLLGIDEKRLMQPVDALARIVDGLVGPVMFVDDFVGSGEQFLKTWRRVHHLPSGTASFASVSARFGASYCNVFATAYGRRRLRLQAPSVALASGNVIPFDHNFATLRSAMWPQGSAMEGARLARRVGRVLGYTGIDGGESDWRGFHRLGLGIAMQDSMPDANLPLFFSNSKGWTPLVRRA